MKIELVSTEEHSRYLVSHAHDIQRYLGEVLADKTLVALYAENGRDFTLSTLLAIDERQSCLYIEQGADARMNARLLGGGRYTVATTHDQVHIQFSGERLAAAEIDGKPAFRLPIPRELLRLQRREYYRLVTSVLNPVKCLVNTADGLLETVVVDISIGGVGILAYQQDGRLTAGEVHHGCRLALPGMGEFALSLTVRSVFDVTLKNGRLTHRAGCAFIDLPASIETAIQRYINQVERERRNRYL